MRRNERGFSYLEILLALTNFGIGFAALLSLNTVIGDRNAITQEMTAATLIGHNQMEALKLQGYNALIDGGTAVDGSAGPLDATGTAKSSGAYTVKWDIQNNVPSTNLKRILLTVSWLADNGKQKKIILDTVISNVIP